MKRIRSAPILAVLIIAIVALLSSDASAQNLDLTKFAYATSQVVASTQPIQCPPQIAQSLAQTPNLPVVLSEDCLATSAPLANVLSFLDQYATNNLVVLTHMQQYNPGVYGASYLNPSQTQMVMVVAVDNGPNYPALLSFVVVDATQ